jgi:three-Cys-motif partner protein
LAREHQKAHSVEFGPHTQLKHSILDRYVPAYVAKLAMGPSRAKRVWLVDGFAGSGHDAAGRAGSPTIIARQAASVRAALDTSFGQSLDVRTILVEADAERSAALRDYVKPFGEPVEVIAQRFDQAIEGILVRVDSDPFFVFLDPFGIRGVSHMMLAQILANTRSEVFVLIDQDGADRLMMAATAIETKANRRLRITARTLDLFADNDRTRAEIVSKCLEAARHFMLHLVPQPIISLLLLALTERGRTSRRRPTPKCGAPT